MNANLQGFSERERAIIANVARYHRRSLPKSSHEGFMALDTKDREIVKQLAAMLRLANAFAKRNMAASCFTISRSLVSRAIKPS